MWLQYLLSHSRRSIKNWRKFWKVRKLLLFEGIFTSTWQTDHSPQFYVSWHKTVLIPEVSLQHSDEFILICFCARFIELLFCVLFISKSTTMGMSVNNKKFNVNTCMSSFFVYASSRSIIWKIFQAWYCGIFLLIIIIIITFVFTRYLYSRQRNPGSLFLKRKCLGKNCRVVFLMVIFPPL